MKDDTSFLDDAESPVNNTALENVMQYVLQYDDVTAQIAKAEESLSYLKDVARKLSEEVIPDLLLNNGLSTLKLENGRSIDVKEDVKVSIPKDEGKKRAALAWLADHGAGGLIKDFVTMQDPTAALIEQLTNAGIEFEREQNVNANSLAAFFREALGLKKGTVATMTVNDKPDSINLFVYKKTTIK